jgi:surfeit locus 1 family protein
VVVSHRDRRSPFRPSLAGTLAVAVCLPILLALGFWQIGRAQEKVRLLEAAAMGQAAPPLNLTEPASPERVPEYRRVVVRGEFLADRQGLLDNQVRDGRVGYDVLTPFRVDGQSSLVLVDRGWLARGARRSDDPAWQTPGGSVTLVGYLRRPMDLPLVSGEVRERFGNLWVVGEINPPLLEPVLGAPVLPRVLRLAPESEYGFRRDWPTVSMTPERHYGYAVQWFGLAAALLVMYIVHGVRRARPAPED